MYVIFRIWLFLHVHVIWYNFCEHVFLFASVQTHFFFENYSARLNLPFHAEKRYRNGTCASVCLSVSPCVRVKTRIVVPFPGVIPSDNKSVSFIDSFNNISIILNNIRDKIPHCSSNHRYMTKYILLRPHLQSKIQSTTSKCLNEYCTCIRQTICSSFVHTLNDNSNRPPTFRK